MLDSYCFEKHLAEKYCFLKESLASGINGHPTFGDVRRPVLFFRPYWESLGTRTMRTKMTSKRFRTWIFGELVLCIRFGPTQTCPPTCACIPLWHLPQ